MGSGNNSNNDKDHNILDQTREFIHETVKTQERREQEKPLTEKVKEKMPDSAEEAGADVGKFFDDLGTSAKKKFNQRVDEGTEREKSGENEKEEEDQEKKNIVDATKEKIHDIRETVYDATKSKEEKEAEEEAEKPLVDKIKDFPPSNLKKYHENKKDDDVEPAVLLD